jgi:cytochrome oxidase Cu insertion factor (SCO1/SenC/PrrC family)
MISGIDFHQYRMGECSMLARVLTASAVASLMISVVAPGQQIATSTPQTADGPAVNDVAPDFTLSGATRYGLLKTPVTLSDYRGRTVVLAFFYQARTKG